MIGPVPGQPEGPEQSDRLPRLPRSGKDQVCAPEHLGEHRQEERKEAVTERLAPHPPRDVPAARQAESPAHDGEKLAAAAVPVAVSLCAADCGYYERYKEAQQSQPGKEYVEKAEDKIGQRGDPQVVVPALFHHATSLTEMTDAGHSLAQLPQPTHLLSSTVAAMPRTTSIALVGHTLTQHPQATHEPASTTALLRFFSIPISFPPVLDVTSIAQIAPRFRDLITYANAPAQSFRTGAFVSALDRTSPRGDAADVFHVGVAHPTQSRRGLAAPGAAVAVDVQRGALAGRYGLRAGYVLQRHVPAAGYVAFAILPGAAYVQEDGSGRGAELPDALIYVGTPEAVEESHASNSYSSARI